MQFFENYTQRLQSVLQDKDWSVVEQLAIEMQNVWKNNKTIYICGNGGSAANALHIANDMVYGAAGEEEAGINIQALSANQSVITCLANDIGYAQDGFLGILGKVAVSTDVKAAIPVVQVKKDRFLHRNSFRPLEVKRKSLKKNSKKSLLRFYRAP